MKKSYYFSELSSSYDAELQDLLNDSEGKSVLHTHLKEKRQELKSILPMIEFSPEMVVPVFYDAFSFSNEKALQAAIQCEPDDEDFPNWAQLSTLISFAPWALPFIEAVLTEPAGEDFMVTAASLEFIRQFDTSNPSNEADEEENSENEEEDDENDLAQAGDDWLGEQGFDSLKS